MIQNIFIVFSILIVIFVIAASNWRVRDFVFSNTIDLPLAENDIRIERSLDMTTSDGITLVGDLYQPKEEGSYPVIVIRTAYGRTTVFTSIFGNYFARRGYKVFIQDVRGTGDSGGVFIPLSNEKRDGRATITWIEQQPWFNGQIVTFGFSYLGFTSNAIAVQNCSSVKAAFSAIAPRTFRNILYGTNGFDFDTALQWTIIVYKIAKENYTDPSIIGFLLAILSKKDEGQIPFDTLPIVEADSIAIGAPVDFYQTFVNSVDPDSSYWSESELTVDEIAGIEVPIFLSSTWHDTILPDVLHDYQTLKAMGKTPRLSIGTGPHNDFKALFRYLRDAKTWFDHLLKGKPLIFSDKPVQFNILSTDEWIEADNWPIPSTPIRFYLGDGGILTNTLTANKDGFTSYIFDPMNPTPAIGGILLATGKPIIDNASLEARDDTIIFTAPAFEEKTYIVGEIKASIHFETNVETSDLFVRVNQVSRSCKTENITDGIQRVFFDTTEGGLTKVELTLIPTAMRFEKGEQLRVVIASGAHPRIARNFGLGSTQQQAFMTEGQAATIKIYHSAALPSYIELPIADKFLGQGQ